MRQHEFTVDLPHSARRLWALFQRYDLWKEYAPAVLDVEVVYPGDAAGNGLLRRVVYPLPFGRRGESFELVKNVHANQGYDYVMLRTGLSGSMTLEPLGPNRTRLRFRERFHITKAWLAWLEGPIYRFMNKKNEQSMRGAAAWLSAHPEFRPDLTDPEKGTDPRPCLGTERTRAFDVAGSCAGRAAAGKSRRGKPEDPWAAGVRRAADASPHRDTLTLRKVCRAGFCRPRHAVGPVNRAARSLSVPDPRTESRVGDKSSGWRAR